MMGSLPNFLNHTWPTTREHERRLVDTPLQVTCNGTVMRGWCNDLSYGGMGFTLAAPLKNGDRIEVEFELPGESTPIRSTAVLRWSDGFRHGCEFLKLTAEITRAINAYLSRPQKKGTRKQ